MNFRISATSANLRKPLRLLLVGALIAVPMRSPAQAIQYRSPINGLSYVSFPEDSLVVRAREAFRADSSVENAVALGTALAGVRQFREAILVFTAALGVHHDHPLLLRWRGHRHLTLREFGLARRDLVTATRLDSTIYGAWYHLGVLEFADGHFGQAARAFNRALPLAPNPGERAGSVDWLYMSLMQDRRPDAALALLARRADSIPAGNAYERRLKLYRGEITPAEVFTPADTADVQLSTLAFGLGHWYFIEGDTARARALYRRSLDAGGWPGFGSIISERELSRMDPQRGMRLEDAPTNACIAGLSSAGGGFKRRTASLLLVSAPDERRNRAERDLDEQADRIFTRGAQAHQQTISSRAGATGQADTLLGWQQLDGDIVLILYRDGRVGVTHSVEIGRDPPGRFEGVRHLASTMTRVIAQERLTTKWPAGHPGDSLEVHASISAEWSDLPLPPWIRRMVRVSAPLFTLAMPERRPPTELPGAIAPRYPERLRSEGIEGTVRLRFVVDTSGRVDLTTVLDDALDPVPRERPLRAEDYAEFRRAVAIALASGPMFKAAHVGPCKFRQEVVQPFTFRLQRSPPRMPDSPLRD